MRLSRQSRLSAALVALFSLLFMQLALSSHSCPGLTTTSPLYAASHQGMPGCEESEMAPPSLCHAYQQEGNQSLDKPVMPDVQPFINGALTLVFPNLDPAVLPVLPAPQNLFLTRTTAPPLAIRNCCFRI
jgi:hypothetical protein